MTITERALRYVTLPFELKQKQVEVINEYGAYNRHGLYLDMGLGKTVCSTVIGIDRLIAGVKSVLVMCPPVIINQWCRWLTSLGIDVLKYEGKKSERADLLKHFLDHDFIVMSPDIFRNDFFAIKDVVRTEVLHVIIDEANLIKKHTGVTHQKLRLLQGIDRGVTLLTGTPLTAPIDAYGYIKIITPYVYSTIKQFKRIHVAREGEYHTVIEYDNLDMLKKNFYLQSISLSVDEMIDMPEIDYQVVEYDLEPAHLDLYRKLLREKLMVVEMEDGKTKVLNASKVQTLRHWAQRLVMSPHHLGYTKLPVGMELIREECLNNQNQVVIFSNYVETNARMLEVLPSSAGVYGEINRQQQQKNIEAFQNSEVTRLVVNPSSGGVGLELQGSCNHVIFGEFPVTSVAFRQARSRVWRQGQKKKVICKVFVANKTVQPKLLESCMRKDEVLVQVQYTLKELRRELLGE